jgi:hypothetical protein
LATRPGRGVVGETGRARRVPPVAGAPARDPATAEFDPLPAGPRPRVGDRTRSGSGWKTVRRRPSQDRLSDIHARDPITRHQERRHVLQVLPLMAGPFLLRPGLRFTHPLTRRSPRLNVHDSPTTRPAFTSPPPPTSTFTTTASVAVIQISSTRFTPPTTRPSPARRTPPSSLDLNPPHQTPRT